jgi:hypothetical protein
MKCSSTRVYKKHDHQKYFCDKNKEGYFAQKFLVYIGCRGVSRNGESGVEIFHSD